MAAAAALWFHFHGEDSLMKKTDGRNRGLVVLDLMYLMMTTFATAIAR